MGREQSPRTPQRTHALTPRFPVRGLHEVAEEAAAVKVGLGIAAHNAAARGPAAPKVGPLAVTTSLAQCTAMVALGSVESDGLRKQPFWPPKRPAAFKDLNPPFKDLEPVLYQGLKGLIRVFKGLIRPLRALRGS